MLSGPRSSGAGNEAARREGSRRPTRNHGVSRMTCDIVTASRTHSPESVCFRKCCSVTLCACSGGTQDSGGGGLFRGLAVRRQWRRRG